ncbi:MAG: hypothetical protein NC098_04485 [Lachnoclostridium sp.]|nr:hypothetical protein [Lachnoclostridium sp.]
MKTITKFCLTAISAIVMTTASAEGHDVSNRCSIYDIVTIASCDETTDGFDISAPSVMSIQPLTPAEGGFHGSGFMEIRFTDDSPASDTHTITFTPARPLNLSATPILSYGLLLPEGPGRRMVTSMTLKSADGETFTSSADVIPTLWKQVMFDMTDCQFLDKIAAIDIDFCNKSDELWEGVICKIDEITAGKPLDLDFNIPGSTASIVVKGHGKVKQDNSAAVITHRVGSKFDIYTSDSRNAIYNPRLSERNTVMIALSDVKGTDSLRLYVATDSIGIFDPALSKTVAIDKSGDITKAAFNFSDLVTPGSRQRITGLRIEPRGGSGRFAIERISFEHEDPISPVAGNVTVAVADGKAITIKGLITCKLLPGSKVEVRHSPLWKSELPFDSLELVGAAIVNDTQFEIDNIDFNRPIKGMTHLSSRFEAALRAPDGSLVKFDRPFFIENWRDFHSNPYQFDTPEAIYLVTDFGARGDGVTNDNEAINEAVKAAALNGGGRVVLTGSAGNPREYLATNIELLENVTLVIDSGAVLRQSPVFDHYKEFPPEYGHDNVIPGIPWTHCMYTNRPLILAKDTRRVKITGGGKIRMDDTFSENPAWHHYARTCSDRIHLVPIAICNTRNVEISDIEINRCNNYHTIFYRADSVFIGNLKLLEVTCLSGDGFSFGNAVTNVKVARCIYESNDDGIVLCSSYKDPRGGVWRERVDSIDASVRHIDVVSSYIDGARGGGGKAIAIIPWGSTNPRQDHNEIDDIEVTDCVLRGGHSIGTWPDNPFDGKPFTNTETDDYAPVKNLRIYHNEYLSPCELNGVEPATLLTDAPVHGTTHLKNSNFSDRLAYWSTEGTVSSEKSGEVSIADGTLYQGIYLEPGEYEMNFSGSGEIMPLIVNLSTDNYTCVYGSKFRIPRSTTIIVGLQGKNAKVNSLSLEKI